MIIFLKDLRQFLKPVKTRIDSLVFCLHYKLTPVLLMSFCILLTTEYYWKGYINCMFPGKMEKFIEVVNAYCYVYGVHTMPRKNSYLEIHPGVSPLFNELTSKTDTPKYHRYYQWTTLFFFVQCISFCIPGQIWKNYEGGRLSKLCTHLKDIMASEEERVKKVNDVVAYLIKGLGFNNTYIYMYFFCELLNLANVAIQAIVTDMFLNYEFSTLGTELISLIFENSENRTDPLATIFPKVTKCTYKLYGPSGSIEPHDGVCVLNLNSLNEKLFTIMWFWLLILSFLTMGNFLHRLICVGIPHCRFILLRQSCVSVDAKKLHQICRKFKVGDWFILYLLGKNIDFITFSEVLEAVSVTLQKRPIQPQPRNVARNNGGPPIPPPNIRNPFVDGGAGDGVYAENVNEIYMEQRNYVYA